jgi:hypothetical protein
LRNTYQRRIIQRVKWPIKYWSAFTAAGLAALLLLAALTPLHRRGPVEEVPSLARADDSVLAATHGIAIESDSVTDATAAAQQAASIDLRGESPTFRNSTLVIAIRRAGFYCADVVSAHESADGVWVASCSDMLGYVVTLRAAADRFDVHPVAQYFDGVTPVPVDRERPFEPRSREPQLLR